MTRDRLAVHGGTPVRSEMLPNGHHTINEEDTAAILSVLRSGWLTTGPKVREFEEVFAQTIGSKNAVAVSSGTAALHAAMHVLGVAAGDEVVVPDITFAATANCVVYLGATPVFADVEPDTLCIDPVAVETLVTPRTKAVISVDYAGQPCDYEALGLVCEAHGLPVVADACHALGGSYKGSQVGTQGVLNTFSFHPVKNLTTGEGGMLATDDSSLAARARLFRNHGITTDHHERLKEVSWRYEMKELGFNYRLSDLHCALGISQMSRLESWVKRRREIASRYLSAFAGLEGIEPLVERDDCGHAFHLFVVRLARTDLVERRQAIFAALRGEGVGVNVHYVPVHLHPFYRESYGTREGQCPIAEKSAREILSLPIYPSMSDADADDVIYAIEKVVGWFAD